MMSTLHSTSIHHSNATIDSSSPKFSLARPGNAPLSILAGSNNLPRSGPCMDALSIDTQSQASFVSMAAPQFAEPHPPRDEDSIPPPRIPARPSEYQSRLPKSIQLINEARQVIGTGEFEKRRKQYAIAPTNPPSIPSVQTPQSKLQQLNRRLERVFLKLADPRWSRSAKNDEMQTYITHWVRDLDSVSDQLLLPTLCKQDKSCSISELANLLVCLNRALEEAEASKGVFYEYTGSNIDRAFSKLRVLSTHCEKEIEEFEDEREEWENA